MGKQILSFIRHLRGGVDAKCQGTSKVNASGTRVISAGSVPSSSPSASTRILRFTSVLPLLGRVAGQKFRSTFFSVRGSTPPPLLLFRLNPPGKSKRGVKREGGREKSNPKERRSVAA